MKRVVGGRLAFKKNYLKTEMNRRKGGLNGRYHLEKISDGWKNKISRRNFFCDSC
jgi:hypothetical protein